MIHPVNAGKAIIQAPWKKESPPTLSLWLTKPAEIHSMENIRREEDLQNVFNIIEQVQLNATNHYQIHHDLEK